MLPATGSAFGVNEGVYFIRGTFVDVPTSLIILDPYNNNPSYRVGFDIIEEVVNANDDSSLFDNAKDLLILLQTVLIDLK